MSPLMHLVQCRKLKKAAVITSFEHPFYIFPPSFSCFLLPLDKFLHLPIDKFIFCVSLRSLSLKVKGVCEMLKSLSSPSDLLLFQRCEENRLHFSLLKRLHSAKYRSALHKLRKIDVSLAYDILLPLYSHTGRPAIDPAILIRSFILMQHLGYTSIHNWCNDLACDDLLRWMIGVSLPPSAASHYDFIIRLTHQDPHLSDLFDEDHFKKPPKTKPAHHEKLINYAHTETEYIVDRYKDGAECDHDRMTYTLQCLFNALAVIPSIDMGFIDGHNLILSGDGSSLHIHSNRSGHKVCSDKNGKPLFRYSAPDADVGWDSDLECFYLGYTLYNISYHNPLKSIDLPVHIDLEKASRHDALTTVSASARFFDICPFLHPKYMCFDAASDSLPIFKFFRQKNITPIIELNKRTTGNDPFRKYNLNAQGKPICQNSIPMIDYGYDIQRKRRKFRCPLAMGKIDSCPFVEQCSTSSYGHTVYINDGDNLRLFGPVPYRSDKWKQIYRNRTSTERMNTRILNDYNLQNMKIRNGAKHAFFAIMAGISIHLDAWVKQTA